MAYEVDFNNVSTTGLESSPVVGALAGVPANEARYFKNKYGTFMRSSRRARLRRRSTGSTVS